MQSFLELHGRALLEQGYPIIPIKRGYKFPRGLHDWQHLTADQASLDKWLSNGFADGGVGIQTKHFPAVDLDVRDADITRQLVQWCYDNIGPTAERVGEAPKSLLPYRTNKPFAKIASSKYVDFLGEEHKVEILGDGQQYVAFADHPDTGKPYEWVSDHTLAEIAPADLPTITEQQARDLIAFFESIIPDDWELVETAPSSKAVDPSLSEVERVLAHSKPKVQISQTKLRHSLSLLDPDMRMHDWVRVGMALYHQFDGDEDGFALWDEWSSDGAKYEPAKIRARWVSFEADLRSQNPVTVATILAMAKTERRESDETKEPIDKFLERYVHIEAGDLVCDLNKPPYCAVSKRAEFQAATANVRHEVPAPTQKDEDATKWVPVCTSWLIDRDRKSAQGVKYDPSKPFFFKDENHKHLAWVNEFYMPEFDAEGGDLAVFYEHLEYLFPIEREREWFLSWMAFNVQFPERRCKVTPLHVSLAHGTGRGWIVELMGALLGQWNCTKTKVSALSGEGNSGQYQDYLNKSLFCAIEEVREGNKRYGISDKVRDYLTENFLEVNVKFGGKNTQRVFTNFFFMSNHPDALVLTDQDRRVNVFSGPKEARGRDYYIKLYGWLETAGVAALHRVLMSRDLSDFDWQHAMRTKARDQMIHNNRTETECLFHDLINDPPYPAMLFSQIVDEMQKLSEKDAFDTNIDEGQLTKLLQHHATTTPRMMFGGRDGKAGRAWVVDPTIVNDTKAIRKAVETCGI